MIINKVEKDISGPYVARKRQGGLAFADGHSSVQP